MIRRCRLAQLFSDVIPLISAGAFCCLSIACNKQSAKHDSRLIGWWISEGSLESQRGLVGYSINKDGRVYSLYSTKGSPYKDQQWGGTYDSEMEIGELRPLELRITDNNMGLVSRDEEGKGSTTVWTTFEITKEGATLYIQCKDDGTWDATRGYPCGRLRRVK